VLGVCLAHGSGSVLALLVLYLVSRCASRRAPILEVDGAQIGQSHGLCPSPVSYVCVYTDSACDIHTSLRLTAPLVGEGDSDCADAGKAS
jgi:hypothetical protein